MTLEEKFEHWLDIAQYDLGVAEAMFQSGKWLYVAVMCQQAIEKLCKGLYTLFIDDNVPYTHNITMVFDCFAEKQGFTLDEEMRDFFGRLRLYYVNNRYPEFKAKLNAATDKPGAGAVLAKTKEAFTWLLTLKPSQK
ncbi:MAG: HEPN domain-containing protein [Treponematales bacterium]